MIPNFDLAFMIKLKMYVLSRFRPQMLKFQDGWTLRDSRTFLTNILQLYCPITTEPFPVKTSFKPVCFVHGCGRWCIKENGLDRQSLSFSLQDRNERDSASREIWALKSKVLVSFGVLPSSLIRNEMYIVIYMLKVYGVVHLEVFAKLF